jgi:hypothetical protein
MLGAWVEYRCQKCGTTSIQRANVEVFCMGGKGATHNAKAMRQGLLGQTQALTRNQLVGREVKV